jgi:hypothetical protein
MSARETGAVEPTETGIDAGIEAILAKDDTAIMLDELREILGADIDVDSRFTIAQMLTVMERCFKDGEAWNRMIERAKAAALSRHQPTPSATGEIVERVNALLRMTVPVPAGCVGEEGSPMSPEFRVSVQLVTDEGVHFIIHADGHSSDTLDVVVTDKGLALLAPFKPGETRAERIARTAALIEQQAATIAELREVLEMTTRCIEIVNETMAEQGFGQSNSSVAVAQIGRATVERTRGQ